MEDQKLLLHGTLHATIYEVAGIRGGTATCSVFSHKLINNFESCFGHGRGIFKLYVQVELGNSRIYTTRLIETKHSNPRWLEPFRVYCAHSVSDITFSVKKSDGVIGSKVIGTASIPANELVSGKELDRWLDIVKKDQNHKSLHNHAKIRVKLRFESVREELNWANGVPNTFFKQVDGCRVTLYHDAHVHDNNEPKIVLSGEKLYEPQRCWEDIFSAISNAKHLIYIAGWSIYAPITLIRDLNRVEQFRGEYNPSLTLGELLKKKASEGVRVLMLVWDDRTSVKLLKRDGIMATHDEDTASYFRNSGIQCVLCPREPDKGHQSFVKDLEGAAMFTHHQKTVVVDSDDVRGSGKKRIISFIGGLDLCDGRYDTPTHSLFGTLGSIHHDDFRQPNFHDASIQKGGPRQPWHDVHCQLEGPAAYDVLTNFVQRWRKQGGSEDMLVETSSFISQVESSFPDDPESWKVQIFRSIDAGAALGLQNTENGMLFLDRGRTIERSIQDAYINAIRRAKNFVYIENQYFLGETHLIPKELSLKIKSKIKAGERFSVYIVIPMWPEGIPSSSSVQSILYWQKNTMEMMYRDVAMAIKDKGIKADSMDYLTFFCLANREVKKNGEYVPENGPENDTDYRRAQRNRRQMIYVHAKTMIVDDEYIIIGSANINQRSMDGGRDTEIAMGAFQPHHIPTVAKAQPKGQIHGFRMALWHEHTNELHNCYNEPESSACIRKMNHIASRNWTLYSHETLDSDLPSHLMKYPIVVTDDGEVKALSEFEFFPDTNARVLGTRTHLLPTMLTT